MASLASLLSKPAQKRYNPRGKNVLRSYHLQSKGEVLVTGRSVGESIGQGKATVILDANKTISEMEKS